MKIVKTLLAAALTAFALDVAACEEHAQEDKATSTVQKKEIDSKAKVHTKGNKEPNQAKSE